MKLLKQLKQRREQLDLRQEDMELRIGMKRQQYQRMEAGGNPRLNTLELVAQGLEGEILFIPRERLQEVRTLLQLDQAFQAASPRTPSLEPSRSTVEPTNEVESPWDGILD